MPTPGQIFRYRESPIANVGACTIAIHTSNTVSFIRNLTGNACILKNAFSKGEQGWRSGESTHLSSLWPGVNSRTWCHMWVKFVVGSRPCSESFFWVLRFSSLHKNQHSKFQFDPKMMATGLSALL